MKFYSEEVKKESMYSLHLFGTISKPKTFVVAKTVDGNKVSWCGECRPLLDKGR